LGNLAVDRKIVLKHVLKKQGVRV